ncbi:MAG: DUF952 domain-containing protein [Planctomycetota bacterium]
MIYKILTREQWSSAQAAGTFTGSAVDVQDGFIHFSNATQVRETAAKHFAGQTDLLLLGIREQALEQVMPGLLRWEPSRGGALFPHLYGELPAELVTWQADLVWNGTEFEFPELPA